MSFSLKGLHGRELNEMRKCLKDGAREKNKTGLKLKKLKDGLKDLFEFAEPYELADLKVHFDLILKPYEDKMRKGKVEFFDRKMTDIDEQISSLRKERKQLSQRKYNFLRKPKPKKSDLLTTDDLSDIM